MYKKIDVFINGKYHFTTSKFKTAADLVRYIRAVKHLYIADIPARYLTVYDYDKVTTKQH